jgi:ubiquinone/menaquinone biosynthesis C-methylase UbiE
VIDIGCGSGTTVLELAKRVGPSGYVLGAGISQQSVEKARERIRDSSLRPASSLGLIQHASDASWKERAFRMFR